MKFCPECDNILIPKNKKLYCKACEKEFELNPKTDEYKIVKTIRHDECHDGHHHGMVAMMILNKKRL